MRDRGSFNDCTLSDLAVPIFSRFHDFIHVSREKSVLVLHYTVTSYSRLTTSREFHVSCLLDKNVRIGVITN